MNAKYFSLQMGIFRWIHATYYPWKYFHNPNVSEELWLGCISLQTLQDTPTVPSWTRNSAFHTQPTSEETSFISSLISLNIKEKIYLENSICYRAQEIRSY